MTASNGKHTCTEGTRGGYVVAVVDIIQCAGNYGRTLFLVAFSGALKIAKQTEDDEPIGSVIKCEQW